MAEGDAPSGLCATQGAARDDRPADPLRPRRGLVQGQCACSVLVGAVPQARPYRASAPCPTAYADHALTVGLRCLDWAGDTASIVGNPTTTLVDRCTLPGWA